MADKLFEELGFNKREAKELVEQFFEEIRICLENNEQVKLSGFGNFDLRDKGTRPGRNPKTGEEVAISARRVVTFKPELIRLIFLLSAFLNLGTIKPCGVSTAIPI